MPPIGTTFPKERSGWGEDNPVVVAETMDLADRELRRLRVPLNQARYEIVRNVQSHFDNQEDYDNLPWKEWSEQYSIRQKNIGEILQRTYDLEYAVTNPDNYRIISGSVSGGAYGSGEVALIGSNLPDYWIYHEEGIPDRKTALPKRSFAGLDLEGEAAIDEIFDAWVDGTLIGTLVSGKLGQVGQPRGRGGLFRTHFFH